MKAIILATLATIGSLVLLVISSLIMIVGAGLIVKGIEAIHLNRVFDAALPVIAVLVLIIMTVTAWHEFYDHFKKEKND